MSTAEIGRATSWSRSGLQAGSKAAMICGYQSLCVTSVGQTAEVTDRASMGPSEHAREAVTAMSPLSWSDADVQRLLGLSALGIAPSGWMAVPTARGSEGVLVGSTSPFAVHAGVRALRAGGSAIDAALVTALTQCALAAGCWVSYAGVMSLVCFDASSGQVHALNGSFETFSEETEPLSIPTLQPSGRSALVGGFMAAVQAAHQRFGVLPFAALFEPALFVADEGFQLGAAWPGMLTDRREVVTRLAGGRGIFMKPTGEMYEEGDHFRQPALARTLRGVASHGASFMYSGPWGRNFVDVVRSQGGKAIQPDLDAYTAQWVTPVHGVFQGCDVLAPGSPDWGGAELIEALHLVTEADLPSIGAPTKSPEALYWLMQIARLGDFLQISPGPEVRATISHARQVWQQMRSRGSVVIPPEKPSAGSHSDLAVASDAAGNIVALTHSITTNSWGTSGIFVDGVSIPDSAALQRELLAQIQPQRRVPSRLNPVIFLRNGKPVLACASIGMSLGNIALQNIVNILGFDAGIAASASGPLFQESDLSEAQAAWVASEAQSDDLTTGRIPMPFGAAEVNEVAARSPQTVIDGHFDKAVLDAVRAFGQPVSVLPATPAATTACWGGIQLDSETDEGTGACTPGMNSYAEANPGEVSART